MAGLATLLAGAARDHAGRPALLSGAGVLTYSQLHTTAARFATRLAGLGVRPGDRVVLALPNGTSFPIAFFGVLRAGAVVVPLNPLLTEPECTYHLADSGAVLIVADDPAPPGMVAAGGAAGIPVVRPDGSQIDGQASHAGIPRAGTDTAVLLYTSGTTGRPKGAELTHRNLATAAATYAGEVVGIDEYDVLAGYLPMFHVFGLTCVVLAAAHAGAAVSLLPRVRPAELLGALEAHRVTVLAGVPTMYSTLREAVRAEPADLGALRLCVSGGAPLAPDLLTQVEAAVDAPVLEGYGLSESSALVAFNRIDRPRVGGTIGFPVPGMEVRLVDDAGRGAGPDEVGEIEIRGDGVMKGYWCRPEATAEAFDDGWFRTGDLATRDVHGRYAIVDRKKSVIIRAGYNVYPREVEDVLHAYPGVVAAVVVPVPDGRVGEEVGAALVVRHPAAFDADDLRMFVRQRLAPYKYPRHIWLVDALPQSASGKLLRREVKVPAEVLASPISVRGR